MHWKRVKDFNQRLFLLTDLENKTGMSPFINLISNIILASSDSKYSKSILFKIPLNDILTFNFCSIMNNFRYFFPDQIAKEEIVEYLMILILKLYINTWLKPLIFIFLLEI